MIGYLNKSTHTRTYYGVKFEPNESKLVPGPINAPDMIRISNDRVGQKDKAIAVSPGRSAKLNKETKGGED